MLVQTARRFLLLLAAMFTAVACTGGAEPESAAAQEFAVLRYDASEEQLAIGTLQVGDLVYERVRLRLAGDRAWQLQSAGTARAPAVGEAPQAVLGGDTAGFGPGWRPAAATLTIHRLHIGAKVYGDVPLQLAGSTWHWGHDFQPGADTRDLRELKALTMADFRANAGLVADATHHAVLHTGPQEPVQAFPLQLQAQRYRFCMERQEDGADTIRLLDAQGATQAQLKAGDPCVEAELPAGRYTLQHAYGGSGAARTVFVHPAAAQAAAGPPTLANDDAYPEYWALYLPPEQFGNWDVYTRPGGFLALNPVLRGGTPQCRGLLDAAPQVLGSYTRSAGGHATSYPSETAYFRAASYGVLGPPYACRNEPLAQYWMVHGKPPGPVMVGTAGYGYASQVGLFSGAGNPVMFMYRDESLCFGSTQDICMPYGFAGFGTRPESTALPPIDDGALGRYMDAPVDAYGGLRSLALDGFALAARFFPNGLPHARDANGNWALAAGEAALFWKTEDCNLKQQGPATILKDFAVEDFAFTEGMYLEPTLSLQLGPNTVATVTKGGTTTRFNQSGCIPFVLDGAGISLAQTTQIDVTTNSCEYCNLAGIDLSGRKTGLKNVKLAHANLTGASLGGSDLSGADLRFTTLSGAHFGNANLDQANLCRSFLNAAPQVGAAAADLVGAHLKNANLAGAHLDGAILSFSSFYSSTDGACVADCSGARRPTCASAQEASLDDTAFNGAYLANVDMNHVTGNGTDFSGAMLFGASFRSATFGTSSVLKKRTSFIYAFLQGAQFDGANLDGATFQGAFVDRDTDNQCMQTKLPRKYLAFPGFTVGDPCAPPTDAVADTCVSASYERRALRPPTGKSNTCPDLSPGPCTEGAWTATDPARSDQPNSSCLAPAPLCGDPLFGTENLCWNQGEQP
ncbi:pentapeptide repeat-containing protein [Ramlibacter sp. AN1133]|uniref:pentapeptide repeat-containing protein n=1 Tax=Ramlibacter sp. AN1133 TaxID=3133429 RepID=UPI0030C58BBF